MNKYDSLKYKQSLSLFDKVLLTNHRIYQWYVSNYGQVYVSFSGGKDSTVLLYLVRKLFPDVPAVFCDTGLEYPEIRDFVKTIDNVIWLKPKMNFRDVIEKYGYPVISKEQSQFIYEYRRAKSEKHKNIRINGNKYGMGKISEKWKFLINAPFEISHKCCDIMKKQPAKLYEKETDRKPFIGVMADESKLREQSYRMSGCNAYNTNRPQSRPLMFWTENDIWEYIRQENISYSKIYDMGYKRTGCMFCMYGCHNKDDNRFELMTKTHPKIYNYCMNTLKIKDIINYIYAFGESDLFTELDYK